MKHLLPILTAALLGAATSVFAETLTFEGFSIETSPYQNENNQGVGEGSYYTITKSGSGSLFITNIFNNVGNEGLAGQDELLTNSQYGITHYGYIDSAGGIHDFAIGDTSRIDQFEGYSYTKFEANPENPDGMWIQNTYDVARDGYFLGNFNDGEEIQVYFARKDADGNVVTWIATGKPQDGVYGSRALGRGDAADGNMPVGQVYFPGEGEKQINFGIIASTSRDIVSEGGGSFGSPLPGGVQVALIAGLLGLGFWFIRRRKATVA